MCVFKMKQRTQRQRVIIFIYLSVVLIIIYTLYTGDWKAPEPLDSINEALKGFTLSQWKQGISSSALPKILLWTSFFGHYELSFYGIHSITFDDCPAKCEFTSDKLELMSSDAVVFHIRDVKRVQIPPLHHPEQLWIFFIQESPHNTEMDLSPYKSIFNWTMTYRHDSDVYHPYGLIVPKSGPDEIIDLPHGNRPQPERFPTSSEDAKLQYLLNRPKLAAWVVSNCVTNSNREALVSQLQEFIPVDIYGSCGTLSCPTDDSHDCYRHIASQYKFYFSFENSLCSDYVSEKFFDALLYNMIPVVYGRVNYSLIAPPNSFIDARSFSSSKELAKYLQYLNAHHDEYLKYFKWKNEYKVVGSTGWCELCKKLTSNSSEKRIKYYQNISNWWNNSPKGTPENEKLACLSKPEFPRESLFSRLVKKII